MCTHRIIHLFRHQEIIRWALLSEDSLRHYTVVTCVSRVVPIFNHTTPHCSGFPPVVGLREEAGFVACEVAVVVGHHVVGDCAGGGADGVCRRENQLDSKLRQHGRVYYRHL